MLSPSPVNGWNAEGTPCLFINAVQVWYGSDMVCCMTVYGKVWYMVKYVIVNDEMVYVMVAMVYDKVWYAVGHLKSICQRSGAARIITKF